MEEKTETRSGGPYGNRVSLSRGSGKKKGGSGPKAATFGPPVKLLICFKALESQEKVACFDFKAAQKDKVRKEN